MKQKLGANANDVVKVFENLDRVADIIGISVNVEGIVIAKKKLLGKAEERHVITYSIAKGAEGYVVTFRPSGDLNPIVRVYIKDAQKGCELLSQCLGDKYICGYVDEMLKRLAKNIDTVIGKIKSAIVKKPEATTRFTLSSKYAKVIDGLAEVTLSSLYLRYPLLDRRIVSIDEVKDLDGFLEKLYRLYGSRAREVYVHVSTPHWMFVLAIDFAGREYTPSLIENNTRFVGREAINIFLAKADPYVTVSVLTMYS